MVTGDSGIINSAPPWFRPVFEPTNKVVRWPNGAEAQMFSAEEPSRLRGPQFNAGWCLPGETLVTMADSSEQRIDSIRVGDRVMTRFGSRQVTASAMTRRDAELHCVTTRHGRALYCTPEHKVYVYKRGWVPASDVRAGDTPLHYMEPSQVHASEPSARRADVYDITVAGAHEFFANGILVHNCDEICSWEKLQETYDMYQFGLRLGNNPQTMITTTPKPVKWLIEIMKRYRREQEGPENLRTIHLTKGKTSDNAANLATQFMAQVSERYGGTRLGAQELNGELLEESEQALWKRDMLDATRVSLADCPPKEAFSRMVVAVDPAVSANEQSDETGIVVAGMMPNGHVYILRDLSFRGKPHQWALAAITAYHGWGADRIVAEVNNGGDMVSHTIRSMPDGQAITVKQVHASRGKYTRAEPVAALYAQGMIHHVGTFDALESQLCTYSPQENRKSPDRLDAMVWAVTELKLENSSHKFW
jgi:phage terminase large subunit-like protein